MSDTKCLTILLAVDGSPHSEAAVRLVLSMRWPAGTLARVLAVTPDRYSLAGLSPEAQSVLADTLAGLRRVDQTSAEALTARVTARLRAAGMTAEMEVYAGRPSEVILQRAADLRADLIVIGAKGLSAPGEYLLGSTAHKLAHYADCSVLVARPPQRAQPLSMIFTADGSPEAQRATEFLCALSLPQWAEVTVVSVVEIAVGVEDGEGRPVADVPEVVRRALFDTAEAWTSQVVARLSNGGTKVRSAIRCGHPAKEILSAAEEQDADLILVGARGQTRAGPFRLGGVAQKVVKYAPCSVLVVR